MGFHKDFDALRDASDISSKACLRATVTDLSWSGVEVTGRGKTPSEEQESRLAGKSTRLTNLPYQEG